MLNSCSLAAFEMLSVSMEHENKELQTGNTWMILVYTSLYHFSASSGLNMHKHKNIRAFSK